MTRRKRDTRTLDLFETPRPAPAAPGGLDVDRELRHLVSRVLKETPHSRYEVAARMSELLGVDVTVHQLNAWTAESRDGWRFPLSYLPALEVACDTLALTEWIAGKRGCALLVGEETLFAELGRLQQLEREVKEQIKSVKDRLEKGGAG